MNNKHTTISNCRFAYKCTKTWSSLQTTEHADVKFCNDCQKDVFFCHTDNQLVDAIKRNRCVAFERKSQDKEDNMMFVGSLEGLPDHSKGLKTTEKDEGGAEANPRNLPELFALLDAELDDETKADCASNDPFQHFGAGLMIRNRFLHHPEFTLHKLMHSMFQFGGADGMSDFLLKCYGCHLRKEPLNEEVLRKDSEAEDKVFYLSDYQFKDAEFLAALRELLGKAPPEAEMEIKSPDTLRGRV